MKQDHVLFSLKAKDITKKRETGKDKLSSKCSKTRKKSENHRKLCFNDVFKKVHCILIQLFDGISALIRTCFNESISKYRQIF